MSRGMPSMVALLGLLAVAGYQNREKLGEMLSGAREGKDGGKGQGAGSGGLGGLLGGGGTTAGALLTGGLGELLDRFKQSGQGETADSWVRPGANKPVSPDQLEKAIGEDVLADLAERTGLSRQELIIRLTRNLPDAVDKYTPDGRLPDADEDVRR